MPTGEIVNLVQKLYDTGGYQELNWEGSFEEYLALVQKNPRIARTAYQRIYDMIVSHGFDEYVEYKKRITRYAFFQDPFENGKDAVFGLDIPLMKMVNIFKAAALGYGPERRVFLLHGPVGSAKSTIVRLLKKGLEHYSRTPDGALYTFFWKKNGARDDLFGAGDQIACPMHEDPLRLIPPDIREKVVGKINERLPEPQKIRMDGDLCPPCRFLFRELMTSYHGDWTKLISHIRVRRQFRWRRSHCRRNRPSGRFV